MGPMEYMYSIRPKGTLHGRIHLGVIGNIWGATLIPLQHCQTVQADIMYPMGPKNTRVKEDQEVVVHGAHRYQMDIWAFGDHRQSPWSKVINQRNLKKKI